MSEKQEITEKDIRAGNLKMPETDFQDLGFGTQVSRQSARFIDKDGTFNVRRRGLSFFKRMNLYHVLISLTWPKFFLAVLSSYLVENIIFATVYLLTGVDGLSGVEANTTFGKFLEAFFFSSQTITTLGYGRIAPVAPLTSVIAAIESLLGLLAFALVTGLLYGRFSRPTAKILFSEWAVIAPYGKIKSLQFKMANMLDAPLIEVEVQVNLSMFKNAGNGVSKRFFYPLSLERNSITTFPLTWNVVHPIDESSPVYGMSEKDFEEADTEFMITVKAFDQTFSQTVYRLCSYKYDEILWNRKFKVTFETGKDGTNIVNLDKINETTEA